MLAAGAGRRFGTTGADAGHKLLAPFRGRPLVVWAVEHALEAGFDAVAVVTGAVDLRSLLPAAAVALDNESWVDGQAASLGVAVDWADARGAEAVVIGLGDQPLVPASAWRAVASAGATPIAVATYGAERGHPVRLARSVWSLLDRTGDEGARRLMRARPELVGEVPCAGSAIDIDTVEDLDRWS